MARQSPPSSTHLPWHLVSSRHPRARGSTRKSSSYTVRLVTRRNHSTVTLSSAHTKTASLQCRGPSAIRTSKHSYIYNPAPTDFA
jgi:hypothetical protein